MQDNNWLILLVMVEEVFACNTEIADFWKGFCKQELVEKIEWGQFITSFCDFFEARDPDDARLHGSEECLLPVKAVLETRNYVGMKKLARLAAFLDPGQNVFATLFDMLSLGYHCPPLLLRCAYSQSKVCVFRRQSACATR